MKWNKRVFVCRISNLLYQKNAFAATETAYFFIYMYKQNSTFVEEFFVSRMEIVCKVVFIHNILCHKKKTKKIVVLSEKCG